MNTILLAVIRLTIFLAIQNVNTAAINNSMRRRYTVYVDKRSEDCYFVKDVEYGLSVSFVVNHKCKLDKVY